MATFEVRGFCRSFLGDELVPMPGPGAAFRCEVDALAHARRLLEQPGGAVVGCHVTIRPTDLSGRPTDARRLLHRLGRAPAFKQDNAA